MYKRMAYCQYITKYDPQTKILSPARGLPSTSGGAC